MSTSIARDDNVIIKPRFQSIFVEASLPDDIKWASTIPGKWNGVITKILNSDENKNRYKVSFEVPSGKPYTDYIPVSYLQSNRLGEMSNLEKEYFGVNNNE